MFTKKQAVKKIKPFKKCLKENGETASLLEDTVRVTLTIKTLSPTTDKVAEKEPRMPNCA